MYSEAKGYNKAARLTDTVLDTNALRSFWVLVPILLVYLLLAFHEIERQSLWLDEIITVLGASRNESFLSPDRWFGGRGFLYPVLIEFWPGWGSVEFAFRSFSVLLGGITLCIAYLLGRRLYGERVASIGAILFATSPFLIWYSQEARYITLAIATALLSMYSFHVALSANRTGYWLLYGCTVILAASAFLMNFLLALAQLLYVWGTRSGRRSLRQSLITYTIVCLLFVWWANDGHIRQLSGYWLRLSAYLPETVTSAPPWLAEVKPLDVGGSRESNLFELPYTFFVFSTGFSVGPSVRELQLSRSLATLEPHLFALALLSLLFGGLFVAGLVFSRQMPETGKLLVLCLAVPVLGTIMIAALIPGLTYNVRYVSMAFPAYLFVLAAGIASFRQKSIQITVLSTVLLVNAISLANYYYNPHYAREDARAAARYLESAGRTSDVIVVVGSPLPFEYYYTGSVPVRIIKHHTSIAETLRGLRHLKTEYDRMWLVEIRPWEAGSNQHLTVSLNTIMHISDRKHFAGVDIYEYELSGLYSVEF